MRVSLNWLKEFVDVDLDVESLEARLTMLGLEIESVEQTGAGIKQVFTGRILEITPHPDADKLVVCRTDVGQGEPLQIVCGAKNMKVGDIVPTAIVGAVLPGDFAIAKRKMRGVESQGMMCSSKELGLGADQEGLLILPPDTSIGADAVQLLGLDDAVFDIEVTPNRGDWAGMIGVARELAAAFDKPMRLPQPVFNARNDTAIKSSVTIEAPDLCPRYVGRVVVDVKVGPSPSWLTQRLLRAGQRPINNVVDITNYILLETGQPLHAFDYDKLVEHRIVVRQAKAGERIKTLDGAERALADDMLVIADAKNPVAVAGVMGGFESEVGESTTRVFLESACFNPKSIRRTARALGLITEASQRFQRGADPEMARYAIDRVTQLLVELAGAIVIDTTMDEYPGRSSAREITLRYARTDALLGVQVPPLDQRRILNSLAFNIVHETDTECRVQVPTWRHDATQEADLIEEIVRHYGYDRIPTALPRVRKIEQTLAPEEYAIRALRLFLAGLGYTEMMSLTFAARDDAARAGLNGDMIVLQNPLSEKQAGMRTSLIPGLLSAASHNIRFGNTSIRAFEVGNIYGHGTETLPQQSASLGVLLTGDRADAHWSVKSETLDFFDIKGIAETICEHFAIAADWQTHDSDLFESGHALQVIQNGRPFGALGLVHNKVRARFDIEQPIFLLELNLDDALRAQRKDSIFQPLSPYPPSLRDLAILVDTGVTVAEVLQTVADAGAKLLKDTRIFDVYTGKQVPQGKKSLALNLVFQSPERTLTDEDTQRQIDRILKKLQSQLKAELR